MKTITITVPEDVAWGLREAGMLAPEGAEALETLFRDCLRRYKAGEVIRTAEGSLIPKGPSPTQKEVDAVRAEAREEGRASWLPEALRELDGMDEDVEEDSLPPVSEHARSEARRVLVALKNQPVAPMVYPTEDAEISLYFKPRSVAAAVQVLIESDGAATWSSTVPGHSANGRCPESAGLPLALLMTSLQALSRLSGSD